MESDTGEGTTVSVLKDGFVYTKTTADETWFKMKLSDVNSPRALVERPNASFSCVKRELEDSLFDVPTNNTENINQ